MEKIGADLDLWKDKRGTEFSFPDRFTHTTTEVDARIKGTRSQEDVAAE
jgi:hypothetical protein